MILTDLNQLAQITKELKSQGRKIVRTNGCFDIMHPGHIANFAESKKLGDIVIVGLNGDMSPYRTSKPGRPIHSQGFRALMLDSLKYVDYVYIYNEETPLLPIQAVVPDVLVKGGDYEKEKIVGYNIVTDNGGEVIIIPTLGDYATTNTVNKILSTYGSKDV